MQKLETYDNVYFVVPRCCLNIHDRLKKRNLVSDYANSYETEVVGNYSFNVTNIYTAYYLQKIGVSSVCLSVELKEEECICFLEKYLETFGSCDFEIFGYGRVENMIIKGNILHLETEDYHYYLQDFKNRKFPVYYDGVMTHILNWEKKTLSNPAIFENFRIRLDFFEESGEEVMDIVKRYQ